MIELNILSPADVGYSPDKFEIRDKLTIYLAELNNILNGKPTTVIGAMDKGVDFESLIYGDDINEDGVSQRILEQIKKYSSMHQYFTTKVTTKFGIGSTREICFVRIEIDGVNLVNFIMK